MCFRKAQHPPYGTVSKHRSVPGVERVRFGKLQMRIVPLEGRQTLSMAQRRGFDNCCAG
jgi:hypothetical protein